MRQMVGSTDEVRRPCLNDLGFPLCVDQGHLKMEPSHCMKYVESENIRVKFDEQPVTAKCQGHEI